MSTFAIIAIASSMLLITANLGEGGSVGVNFSRQTSQKLLPSMVVNMCLSNGIEKVKFLSVNDGVLSAFTRSNIQIMVSIPSNELLKSLAGFNHVKAWVQKSITHYIKERDIDIRYLGIGVEPFSFMGRDPDVTTALDFLPQYINHTIIALKEDGLEGKVKVTIPHSTDILTPVEKPSDGDFREGMKERIINALQMQDTYGGPFMIDIYPLWDIIRENRSMEFGLFDGKHNVSVQDGDLTYTNIFDFKYDTLLWALRKNGFGNMKIIVGQTGWPTDGCVGANVKNAKRFYDGILKKIANKKGTPLQPGAELDVYFYSLVDENQRNVNLESFERHYGIYTFDGKPKFNVDFTLQGRDVILEPAQGVMYLPQRWCVVDKNKAKDKLDEVQKTLEKACMLSDCTSSDPGGSCNDMELLDRASYAFNMLFQMTNQDTQRESQECDFDGFGTIVYEKPRIGDCDFPVEILSTLFINSVSTAEMQLTLGVQPSCQERLNMASSLIIILSLPLLCFFLY